MVRAKYIEDFETWSNEFQYYREISVRFGETDMFGHLNNTVPFIYFEEARTKFFEQIGFMDVCFDENYPGIVVTADLQCDYVKQVFYGETLRVYVKVAKLGNSSVDLHYKTVNQKDELCFVGRGLIVHVGKTTGKSIPWPAEWREKMLGDTLFDR
ncbi:MAG: acyl-CoA thioesterase [Bacillaceae bacterium]